MSNWTLFSNHGHVLVCLAADSEARLRDVAADVGITERAVQKIVRDLQSCGMISVTKHGRRNRYRIHHKKTLRHDLEAHCTIGSLLKLVIRNKPDRREVKREASGKKQDIVVANVAVTTGSPKTEVTQITEEKPAKPSSPDNIERQQGSLF